MKQIYRSNVHVRGGRDGHARTDNGSLDLPLALPTDLGGSGAGANPEQLFAAGYGACFASTIAAIAKAQHVDVQDLEVDARVSLWSDGQRYELELALAVQGRGASQAELARLAKEAEGVCPYSLATRNNIKTTVTVAATPGT